MKGNKIHIDGEILNKFVDVAQGDRKLAESIINQVLQGYVLWQEMLIQVKGETNKEIEDFNN